MKNPIPLFDPHTIAFYEVANYVAYYQKRWPTLLRYTVGLIQQAFGLSLPRAIQGAYLYARAEIAFAPFPNNDPAKTEAYLTRFYRMVKQVHMLSHLDERKAAQLDVRWWIIHREQFANADTSLLANALADLLSYAYQTPKEQLQAAAQARADAMLISDRWVRAGKDPNSSLLRDELKAMTHSYVLLKDAILAAHPSAQPTPALSHIAH